jgi:hypothetical protein
MTGRSPVAPLGPSSPRELHASSCPSECKLPRSPTSACGYGTQIRSGKNPQTPRKPLGSFYGRPARDGQKPRRPRTRGFVGMSLGSGSDSSPTMLSTSVARYKSKRQLRLPRPLSHPASPTGCPAGFRDMRHIDTNAANVNFTLGSGRNEFHLHNIGAATNEGRGEARAHAYISRVLIIFGG